MSLKVMMALCVAVAISAPALGQNYAMHWSTFDGGGGRSQGGTFGLEGSVGQFDAGVQSGGSFLLEGGFWLGVDVLPEVCPPGGRLKGTYKSGGAVAVKLSRLSALTDYEVDLINSSGEPVKTRTITTSSRGKGSAEFRNISCDEAAHWVIIKACGLQKKVKRNCQP